VGAEREFASRLAEALRKRGYSVLLEEQGAYRLRVESRGVSACVIVSRGAPETAKLSIEVPCDNGITVIECSNLERVVDCVERLLEVLRKHRAAE